MKKKFVLLLTATLFLAAPICGCADKTPADKRPVDTEEEKVPDEEEEETTDPTEPYDAPEAPADVVEANTFTVQLFSNLIGSDFFAGGDYGLVVAKIKAGRRSVVMIDGCVVDYSGTPPYVNPIASICSSVQSRTEHCFHFFTPFSVNAAGTKGCGMLFGQPITSASHEMIGAKPLSLVQFQKGDITAETGFYSVGGQIEGEELCAGFDKFDSECKIVIGTIDASYAGEWKEYLRNHIKDFRVYFPEGVAAGGNRLYILSHVSFAVRGCEAGALSSAPDVFDIKIEKLEL